jgi:hypothetical protein
MEGQDRYTRHHLLLAGENFHELALFFQNYSLCLPLIHSFIDKVV